MSKRSRCGFGVVVLALVALPSACRTAQRQRTVNTGLSGEVITASAIARSHAKNAWEVLEHNAHFTVTETVDGEPARIESRRGRSSILLTSSGTPLIYLDGTQLFDVRILREIAAESIESIHLLNGIDGTTYYGTNAGAGVILIQTKAGPSS